MAGVRFTALQSRPMEFLDFTSVTLDEFQQLVPPFETAFQCHMAVWRMDGKRRTARRFTVYKNCPLPTPEDRLLFTLIGSRALAAYGDVDGPSAANNHPGSRTCTARLLRRSETSASAHGCAGTRSVRLGGAGSVG